ncbi:MAG: carboxypeptidase regulatory-like domain-containing protein, partial [Planctomycetales bacterium]|nr:carboxypeptidase regulatory-like domain-containing protein [Planctomycetales bacterium]
PSTARAAASHAMEAPTVERPTSAQNPAADIAPSRNPPNIASDWASAEDKTNAAPLGRTEESEPRAVSPRKEPDREFAKVRLANVPAFGQILTIVWLSGVGLLLARLGLAIVKLTQATRNSQLASDRIRELANHAVTQMQARCRVETRISTDRSMPIAFWWRRWVIILPASADSWSDERLRYVLAHELGHVVRRDALTDFVSQIVACLYWFHPLVWLVSIQCRQLRELACDDLVLYWTKASRASYATHLLEVVTECSATVPPLASAIAGASHLERRIRRLLIRPVGVPPSKTSRRAVITASILLISASSLCRLTAAGDIAMEGNTPTTAVASDEVIPPTGNSRVVAAEVRLIRGVVVDEQQKPIMNAELALYTKGRETELAPVSPIATTRSAADGSFSFVDPGRTVTLIANADQHAVGWWTLDPRAQERLEIELGPASTLEGLVLDGTGAPIAGAFVQLRIVGVPGIAFDHFSPQVYLSFDETSGPPSTTTDHDGRFSFGRIPAHSIAKISLSHPDYAGESWYVAVDDEQSAGEYSRSRRSIDVVSSPARLVMRPGYRLQVRFLDGEKPLQRDIRVGAPSLGRQRFTPSDEGLLRFTVAKPDACRLWIQWTDDLEMEQVFNLDDTHLESPLQDDIHMPPTRSLAGRVSVRGTNGPVAGVRVTWMAAGIDEGSMCLSHTETAADGTFRLAAVPGEGKLILAGHSDQALIATDARRTEPYRIRSLNIPAAGDIPLVKWELPRGLVVRGTVRNASGSPQAKAQVRVSELPWHWPDGFTVTADANGRFELSGLNPHHDYQLVATYDRQRGSVVVAGDTSRSFDEEFLLDRDIEVQPTIQVAGRVVRDGKPLTGATVELVCVTPAGSRYYQSQVDIARTREDGTYQLTGLLPDDRWHLSITYPKPDNWLQLKYNRPRQPDDLKDQPGSPLELVDLELPSPDQTLSGTVVDRQGNPVANAKVVVDFAPRTSIALPRGLSAELLGLSVAETNTAGEFQLTHLPRVPLRLTVHGTTARVQPEINQRDIQVRLQL